MKIWLRGAITVLFLFSGICFAQVPIAPLPTPSSSEFSFSYLGVAKNRTLSQTGFGGAITASHYINSALGFQVEGDYVRMNFQNIRDAGLRLGPVVRLRSGHLVQPYFKVMLGYSEVKTSYLNPSNSFNGTPSFLAGAGVDIALSQGWLAQVGLDAVNDWTATPTRTMRLGVGLSHRFGVR